MKLTACVLSAGAMLLSAFPVSAQAGREPAPAGTGERLRLVIETDLGGDPDDEQSLVRFLLYASEWDVAGIIANRPVAREGENRNRERTGLGIARAMLRAYGECHASLRRHDERYPSAEELLTRTVPGYDGDDGVRLIIDAVDDPDPRPLWFCNWGTDRGSAPSSLRQALERVREERGEEGYAKFKSRLRLASYDAFGDHTDSIAPPWPLWIDTFRPEIDGRRWYHRFSALTARAGGFDIEKDVRSGHGALGVLYPTNTTHPQKEGDTMCFLYLVPNGLGDPEHPEWGSWAGRYGPREDAEGRRYYWADAADTLAGTTHREVSLARWAVHLQNDFKARMDWCVSSFVEANHPPRVILNGAGGHAPLRIAAKPGASVRLDAAGTTDPDGDGLAVEWVVYTEAGTYPGSVDVRANGLTATLECPDDAAGKDVHVLLVVTDDGAPPLTRYRRAVIECREAAPDAQGER